MGIATGIFYRRVDDIDIESFMSLTFRLAQVVDLGQEERRSDMARKVAAEIRRQRSEGNPEEVRRNTSFYAPGRFQAGFDHIAIEIYQESGKI